METVALLEDVEEILVTLKHMCMCFSVLLYKQIVSMWVDQWLPDHANIWILVELGRKIGKINAVIFPLHVNGVLRVLTTNCLQCKIAFIFKIFHMNEKSTNSRS